MRPQIVIDTNVVVAALRSQRGASYRLLMLVDSGKFEDLKVGQEVRFSEAAGDKGPQATSVRPVGKHHVA